MPNIVTLLQKLGGLWRPASKPPRLLETMPLQKFSASGTIIAGGVIQGYETNPEFAEVGAWPRRAREMKRGDTRAAALDMVVRHMLKSAKWKAVPASDRRNARRNADFLNEAFGWDGAAGRMERTWEAVLGSVSHFAGVGFWVCEEIYKYEDGQYWLSDLSDLEPDSIHGWFTDRNGDLSHIQQLAWSLGEPPPKPLPAHKASIFTLGKTGRNWEGCGLLRPCHVWYELRGLLIKALGDGAQNWANPVPRVTIDRSQEAAVSYTPDQINQMIEFARAQAAAYRSGSVGYVTDTPVTAISTYGERAYDGVGSIIEGIRQANLEMAQAYQNLTLDLGTGPAEGSYALGKVNYDLSLQLYEDGLDGVKDTISGHDRPGGGVCERLLRLNFYGSGRIPANEMPRIVHSGVTKDALAEALPQLPNLIGAKLLTSDGPLENAIRGLIGVSTLTDEEIAVRYPSTVRAVPEVQSGTVEAEAPVAAPVVAEKAAVDVSKIPGLINVGALTPTNDVEQSVRHALGLSAAEGEALRSREDRMRATWISPSVTGTPLDGTAPNKMPAVPAAEIPPGARGAIVGEP